MSHATWTSADEAGLAAVLRVQPMLVDLKPAREAFDFPAHTLLHAGPPFQRWEDAPMAVLNSATAAAQFEGWSTNREQFIARLAAGELRLAPAQDHRCAVPLASVLSPSQFVQVVQDASDATRQAFSSLNGGSGPALRLGLPTPNVVEHLRWLNTSLATAIRPACQRGIALHPIADLALSEGDDLHGRTQAATRLLTEAFDADGGLPALARDYLAASPSFFLNLWMAATKCMLSAAQGIEACSLVTALGGNGHSVGVQLAGRAGHWTTLPSTPPIGRLEPGFPPERSLPAIGDSAAIEAFGLGAMAFEHSPAQRQNFLPFLTCDPAERARALLMAPHPAFPRTQARVGLNARQAAASDKDLVVALGVIDAQGQAGRIGGGLWTSTPALFQHALAQLSSATLSS